MGLAGWSSCSCSSILFLKITFLGVADLLFKLSRRVVHTCASGQNGSSSDSNVECWSTGTPTSSQDFTGSQPTAPKAKSDMNSNRWG